ncbi:hypothetical protein Bca52824_097032 [Brassica carinata]|uniref:Uncharacterized protein n=1 Tax=Brassica carinata TaxID=52824 RepID=A0A8X7NZ01_BRACI|nr:hypothetical protein Bca52824_097032 [Brassica carinata]
MDSQSVTHHGRENTGLNTAKDAIPNNRTMSGRKEIQGQATRDGDQLRRFMYSMVQNDLLSAIHSWPQIGRVTKEMVYSYFRIRLVSSLHVRH